jgi:hypothetical protein
MGGDHDLMDAISHHGAEGITHAQARNREYLCSIMEDCGFNPYECEWWHYALKDEPYPDSYFDFPITSGTLLDSERGHIAGTSKTVYAGAVPHCLGCEA